MGLDSSKTLLLNPPQSVLSGDSGIFQIWQVMTISLTVLIMLFLLFIIYKIYLGKNWARVIYLAIFIIVVIANTITLVHFSITSILNMINFALEALAIILLFTRPSNTWFRYIKEKNCNGI